MHFLNVVSNIEGLGKQFFTNKTCNLISFRIFVRNK